MLQWGRDGGRVADIRPMPISMLSVKNCCRQVSPAGDSSASGNIGAPTTKNEGAKFGRHKTQGKFHAQATGGPMPCEIGPLWENVGEACVSE